jgi:hypothetical protein
LFVCKLSIVNPPELAILLRYKVIQMRIDAERLLQDQDGASSPCGSAFPASRGIISREATEDEELRGYGDPPSNAEAMALKRAAAKFGLGLYLYSK